MGGIFAIPSHLSIGALSDEQRASDFLGTLWQVLAGALGLSVALVVVAYQVFASGVVGALRRSIQESGLLPLLYVGIAALIVDGLVLLQVRGMPIKGVALWATFVSGLGLLLLPVLFARATRAIDVAEIQRARAAIADDEVQASVDQDAFDRIAFLIVRDLTNNAPIDLQLFLAPRVQPEWRIIRSSRVGHVIDIDAWRLGRLARFLEHRQAGRVILGVRIGQRVDIGSTLLALPPNLPERFATLAAKVCRVEA